MDYIEARVYSLDLARSELPPKTEISLVIARAKIYQDFILEGTIHQDLLQPDSSP